MVMLVNVGVHNVGNQVVNLIPTIFLTISFLVHNLQWKIWIHFRYLHFKTSSMLYWKLNLDHIYYLHFVCKFWNFCGIISPNMFFIWDCFGLFFLHSPIFVGVYLSPEIFLCISFSCELKFHFETMVLSVGFVLSWIQNLRNFGIIKVGNKYFWIWLTNMVYFFVKKINEIDLCEVIT
jgi:hypothetical protein